MANWRAKMFVEISGHKIEVEECQEKCYCGTTLLRWKKKGLKFCPSCDTADISGLAEIGDFLHEVGQECGYSSCQYEAVQKAIEKEKYRVAEKLIAHDF
jgi:hypothetical protein